MVIKMKMPISMMVYIIRKLIADKKDFTIISPSMDLRFEFAPTTGGMWYVATILDSVGQGEALSYSYFEDLDVDTFRDLDLKDGEIEGYDVLSFILHCRYDVDVSQEIIIRDKNPELIFEA